MGQDETHVVILSSLNPTHRSGLILSNTLSTSLFIDYAVLTPYDNGHCCETVAHVYITLQDTCHFLKQHLFSLAFQYSGTSSSLPFVTSIYYIDLCTRTYTHAHTSTHTDITSGSSSTMSTVTSSPSHPIQPPGHPNTRASQSAMIDNSDTQTISFYRHIVVHKILK